MARTFVFFGILGVLVLAVLLNMLMLPPGSAAQEPEPRPSPTPQPWIQLTPDQGAAGQDMQVLVTGMGWPSPGSVQLNWERADGPSLAGGLDVGLNGEFSANVFVPAGWATPGAHFIFATHSTGQVVAASLSFVPPTPTDTPSPTPTSPPTDTPLPRPTSTWTPTPLPTLTPTPSRTMRPVTPDVTSTPRPAATTRPATATTQPGPVVPVTTEDPTATPSATPMFLAMASTTPSGVETPAATATPTASATATATPSKTSEATPTFLPIPRETRALGQQLSQVVATPQPAALVEAGAGEAGSPWESGFVQGFIAAVILVGLLIILALVVLAAVLVTLRMKRMRGTGGTV